MDEIRRRSLRASCVLAKMNCCRGEMHGCSPRALADKCQGISPIDSHLDVRDENDNSASCLPNPVSPTFFRLRSFRKATASFLFCLHVSFSQPLFRSPLILVEQICHPRKQQQHKPTQRMPTERRLSLLVRQKLKRSQHRRRQNSQKKNHPKKRVQRFQMFASPPAKQSCKNGDRETDSGHCSRDIVAVVRQNGCTGNHPS